MSYYADPTADTAISNVTRRPHVEARRGDIFYIYKDKPSVGSEQNSGRPGIIVSNDIGNSHSPVVEVVYLTTQEKSPLPTHCTIICRQESTALCEQIHTVSVDRLGDYIKTCTLDEMREIDSALMISLGITEGVDVETHNDLINEYDRTRDVIDDLKDKLKSKDDCIRELQTQVDRRAEPTDYREWMARANLYKELYKELLEKVLK